jgi:PAS domain S-box-containing protein
MTPTLLNLDPSQIKVALISLIPAMVNVAIFVYIFFFLPRSKTNTSFAVFVFLAGMWQMCEGLMKMSETAETALAWHRVAELFIICLTPSGIFFVLFFSQWMKKVSFNLLFTLLFLPGLSFIVAISQQLDECNMIKSSHWNWIPDPKITAVTLPIYIWCSLGNIVIQGLLWYYYSTVRKDKSQRRRALLLALGFTVPGIAGIITEVILPIVFKWNSIPVANSVMAVFSISSALLIKNYKSMDYSPKHHWEQIVQSMNEGLIIINNSNQIMYANKIFCELVGYTLKELRGKVAHDLFLNDGEKEKVLADRAERRKTNQWGNYEIQLKTKEGGKVWMMASGSPYLDKNGLVIGSIGILTDINKIKKTEGFFRALIENADEIIVLVNKEGEIFYFSPALERLTGYAAEEIVGKNKTFLMHPDHILESEKVRQEIITCPGKIIHRTSRFRKKDGTYLWVEGTTTNLLHDENVCALVVNFRDISARKIMEEELEQSEKNLKEAQAISNMGSWQVDFVNNSFGWSDESYEILGIEKGEIEPSLESFLSFIHPEDLAQVKNVIFRSNSTLQGFSYHCRIIRKDGLLRYVYSDCRFVLDKSGKPVRMYGIMHDITDRKLIEEHLISAKKQLEKNEHSLKEAQAMAHLGNWEVDLATNKVTWSDENYRILGYQPGSVEPSSDIFQASIHPDDLERVKQILENSIKTCTPYSFYHRVVHPSGEIRRIFSSAQFDFDASNKPLRLYGTGLDVTEISEKEEKLKVANKDLEMFIYKASHDLRGPLASIIGLTQISQLEINDPLAGRYLSMIDGAARKLDSTLISLTQSMHIKDTKVFDNEINFDELILNACSKFEYSPGFSRLQIKSNVLINTSFVSSKVIIESIIQNLIENAIKYQNYNSSKSFLNINVVGNCNKLRIELEDNGIGIDKFVQQKIFEMYFRGTTESTGSGLGLYLVKVGVDRLGGKIDIESEKGKGTTFVIDLPLEQKN